MEAATNIVVGQLINFALNLYALPLWGFHPTPRVAIEMGIAFTIVSMARSYVLRRVFNRAKFGNEPDVALVTLKEAR